MQDVKQRAKDTTAIGLILSSGGLFVARACDNNRAIEHACEHALTAASVAAPLGTAFGFLASKASKSNSDKKQALKWTVSCGAAGAIAAGAIGGFVSLAWDAFHA